MRTIVTRSLAVASALLATSPAGLAFAQNGPSQPRVLGYPVSGVQLGQGWDSQAVLKTQAVCIEFVPAMSTAGQQVSTSRSLVNDTYSLEKALSVSADVSVKSITGSAVDAKSTYSQKTQINGNYLNVVQLVSVDNGWQYAAPAPLSASTPRAVNAVRAPAAGQSVRVSGPDLQKMQAVHQSYASYFGAPRNAADVGARDQAFAQGLQRLVRQGGGVAATRAALKDSGGATVRLTDWALKLASQPDKSEFRRECGDSFVSAIKLGGELAATYTVATTDTSVQQEITGQLGLTYASPTVNASANVSVSDAFKSSSTHASTAVTYYKSGGSGDPAPVSLDDIDALVKGMPASVASAPYNYAITVMDYRNLPNWPQGAPGMPELTGFQKVAWEWSKADALFQQSSAIIQDLQSTSNSRSYMTARWGYGMQDLANIQAAASARKQAMNQAALNCVQSNASSANTAPSCPDVDIFDDLRPRTAFPMLLGPGNVSDTLAVVWGDAAAYRQAVMNRWVTNLNATRCADNSDPRFCQLAGPLMVERDQIKAPSPVYAALELVDQPGNCVNFYGGAWAAPQPCPSSASASGFFVRFDPSTSLLKTLRDPNNCVYAVQLANQSDNAALGVRPGCAPTGKSGVIVTIEQWNGQWDFRAATSGGQQDNTGAYMVISGSGPAYNLCVDAVQNGALTLHSCSAPKKVRVWMAATGS